MAKPITRGRSLRTSIVRPIHRAGDELAVRVLSPKRLKRFHVIPSLPAWFRRRYAAVRGPWPSFERAIPDELATVPGIRREGELEDQAFREAPLHSFHHNYSTSVVWSLARLWQSVVPVAPRLMRAIASAQATADRAPRCVPTRDDPQALTARVRAEAAALGMSAIGIARYDERYTFADAVGEARGETIIVCVLEQNWAATQTLPGPVGEQTALSTNAELMEMGALLALRLLDAGFEARAHTTEGIAIVHHYAVEAGLGQLGYNGQLLTPHAGSRCRLALVSTNAPLVVDRPRDFGIPGLCRSCRACVRRCPAGAIPGQPAFHRGVEKAKLNLKRCFPVVAQVNGCSICMKVCPVQRYGLTAVLDHYERTGGEILGAGTDELEGYDWPLDGVRYGPNDRPRLDPAFFDVPGFGRYATPDQPAKVVENPLM
jgi:ferredoxin